MRGEMCMHEITARLRCEFSHDWSSWVSSKWEGSTEGQIAMRDALFIDRRFARPLVCLATAIDGQGSLKSATSMARVCQLLHISSCILDDLPSFDDSSCRNGRPAIHVGHGEHVAILVALRLFNASFRQICEEGRKCHMLSSAVATVEAMIQGEALSMEHGEPSIDERVLKCGSLFGFATMLGSQSACARQIDGEQANRVGRCIGLLYQEIDDALDEQQAGAPVARDWSDHIESRLNEIPKGFVTLRHVAADIMIEKLMTKESEAVHVASVDRYSLGCSHQTSSLK